MRKDGNKITVMYNRILMLNYWLAGYGCGNLSLKFLRSFRGKKYLTVFFKSKKVNNEI